MVIGLVIVARGEAQIGGITHHFIKSQLCLEQGEEGLFVRVGNVDGKRIAVAVVVDPCVVLGVVVQVKECGRFGDGYSADPRCVSLPASE